MYSVTDRQSFDAIDRWFDDKQNKIDRNPVIFLVGNKIDLAEERVVSYREGKEKALSIGAKFFEVSAKENIGITELFDEVPRAYFARGPVVEYQPANGVKPIAQRASRCDVL